MHNKRGLIENEDSEVINVLMIIYCFIYMQS